MSDWPVVDNEALGRERKVWLQEPGTSSRSSEPRWLFKPVVVPSNGRRQGEDWAEKLASDLGRALGMPCAEVELATRHGTEGSISHNIAPDGWNLVLGAVLLSARNPEYRGAESAPRGRPGHTPAAIRSALDACAPSEPGALDAFETFAGYLVFDAWIANQDRHDQNWGVLRRGTPPAELVLAPSFDHASGLGFNLDDERRTRLLDGGLDQWVRRARAHRFEHDPDLPRAACPTLVDLARVALEMAGPAASAYWLGRLDRLDTAEVARIVSATPRMSGVAATFATELLTANRDRLLR